MAPGERQATKKRKRTTYTFNVYVEHASTTTIELWGISSPLCKRVKLFEPTLSTNVAPTKDDVHCTTMTPTNMVHTRDQVSAHANDSVHSLTNESLNNDAIMHERRHAEETLAATSALVQSLSPSSVPVPAPSRFRRHCWKRLMHRLRGNAVTHIVWRSRTSVHLQPTLTRTTALKRVPTMHELEARPEWKNGCPYCKHPLETRSQSFYKASMDRIDTTLNYYVHPVRRTPNYVLCCQACNYMRNDADIVSFRRTLATFANSVANYVVTEEDRMRAAIEIEHYTQQIKQYNYSHTTNNTGHTIVTPQPTLHHNATQTSLYSFRDITQQAAPPSMLRHNIAPESVVVPVPGAAAATIEATPTPSPTVAHQGQRCRIKACRFTCMVSAAMQDTHRWDTTPVHERISVDMLKTMYIQQGGYQRGTNIPLLLNVHTGPRHLHIPSLDHIDPHGNSSIHNVQLVCYAYNTMKNHFTEQEAQQHMHWLRKHLSALS